MKMLIKAGIFSILTLFILNAVSFGQSRGGKKARSSPNAAVSQTIGTTVVSISYGRPGLKGRSLESLAPAGTVWRTGANESAAITFSENVLFGGKEVEAGTYSLYAIPGKENWTVILNSMLSWGTRYDKDQDVVQATASVSKGSEIEWFQIDFDHLSEYAAHLNMRWGDVVASIKIVEHSSKAAE